MQESTSKVLRGAAIGIVVFVILGGGYYAGFKQGERQAETLVIEGVTNTATPIGVGADFGSFWEAWSVINETYLRNDDVTNEAKVQGAIRGMVEALGDPYTQYFNREDSKQFQEDVQGNFSGIGAEIGIRKDQLVVVAPLKGSPAERNGLRAGDKIVAINASSTEGISIDGAVQKIRGEEGTVVTLTIFRDGWEKVKDVPIKRESIEVPTLTFEMKEGNIAYIQLSSFNANAPQLFGKAINDAANAGAKGVLLDLRNNPGGYLNVATELAGWFLPKGTLVVSEESRLTPAREELKSTGNAALKDIPVVILINGGSASASEILAGSLRDNMKAVLVGEKSFGKGTVQQIMSLKDDASVKVTIAHWVLPSGQILDHDGLKPDVEVELTDEDIAAERDTQLIKAIEILKGKIR